MARTRISTTVAEDRLARARSLATWRNDAEMMDEALSALIARYDNAEVDVAYAQAYAAAPSDTPDAWGDLAAFRDAASRT